jgi:hypothetical protein
MALVESLAVKIEEREPVIKVKIMTPPIISTTQKTLSGVVNA